MSSFAALSDFLRHIQTAYPLLLKSGPVADMPTNIENYIHRIGRTGRAGSFGKSISFFCDDDSQGSLGESVCSNLSSVVCMMG